MIYRKHIAPHLPQFFRYLGSGFTAAAVDIGSFRILLAILDGSAVLAAAISGFLGILTVFAMNKYLVFQKKEGTMEHAWRFAVVQFVNYLVQVFVVYIIVEVLGTYPFIQSVFDPQAFLGGIIGIEMFAKIAGIGLTVCWNFFLYKFLVYV